MSKETKTTETVEETTEVVQKPKSTTKKSQPKFVDKTYKLTKEVAPLSLILSSRHTSRFPLLWFDEETGCLLYTSPSPRDS